MIMNVENGMEHSTGQLVQVFFLWCFDPITGHGLPVRGFAITLRHTILGRTPQDEWPARRTDHYLTTHNTQKRQTSIPPVGFEPTISESERPQTQAWDHAVTGVGNYCNLLCYNFNSHTEENHINACKDRQSLAGEWSTPPAKKQMLRACVCVGGGRNRERQKCHFNDAFKG